MAAIKLWGRVVAFLPEASSFAPKVDGVFAELLVASLVVVVLLGSLTLGILIRYRRGVRANRAALRMAQWKIETAWICGTLVVFLFFFWRGMVVFLEIRRPPQLADQVAVVGRQWMWDFRHADGRREFNSLHVRVNQPVVLELSAEDVIHSFFVPAFRLKQDLVPGKIVDAWFTATAPGIYTLFCAQYCGTAHAEMLGKVIVLDRDAYAAWEARAGQSPVAPSSRQASPDHGKALFAEFGCLVCHGDPSHVRGPELTGIYESLVRLADGRAVRAGDRFLHDAILHAPANEVPGYSVRMPDYEGTLSEADVADLVSYLKTFGGSRLAKSSP
jgi:cytochrome c oxidase subunit 2